MLFLHHCPQGFTAQHTKAVVSRQAERSAEETQVKQPLDKTTAPFTEGYLVCDLQQTMHSFPVGPQK